MKHFFLFASSFSNLFYHNNYIKSISSFIPITSYQSGQEVNNQGAKRNYEGCKFMENVWRDGLRKMYLHLPLKKETDPKNCLRVDINLLKLRA